MIATQAGCRSDKKQKYEHEEVMNIFRPTQEDLKKFGMLAYIPPDERARILALPPYERKSIMKRLERKVKEYEKKARPERR